MCLVSLGACQFATAQRAQRQTVKHPQCYPYLIFISSKRGLWHTAFWAAAAATSSSSDCCDGRRNKGQPLPTPCTTAWQMTQAFPIILECTACVHMVCKRKISGSAAWCVAHKHAQADLEACKPGLSTFQHPKFQELSWQARLANHTSPAGCKSSRAHL